MQINKGCVVSQRYKILKAIHNTDGRDKMKSEVVSYPKDTKF